MSTQFTHIDGADLWDCPCDTCIKLDWEAMDDSRPTLAEHRRQVRIELAEIKEHS